MIAYTHGKKCIDICRVYFMDSVRVFYEICGKKENINLDSQEGRCK